MEIINCLNWLKKVKILLNYNIIVNNGDIQIDLTYNLYSAGITQITLTPFDLSYKMFKNCILEYADKLEENFYNCLQDENDFYGYDTKEKLDERIEEERQFLYSLISIYEEYKKYKEMIK